MFVHERSRRVLSAYHDGELSPAASAAAEQHMNECRTCREEYRRLAEVANAVRHLPRQEAPPSLARVVRRRIDEELRGMVPVLREEILSSHSRPILVPALSLGALVTLGLLALVLALALHAGPESNRFEAVWGLDSLPPVLLQADMTSPRFRYSSVNMLPFTEVERGQEGTLLTLASIDQTGAVRELEVIHRSGDEQMLARTLEVLRKAGFEPARLGKRKVSVDFLYLFTTTEVRAASGSISSFRAPRLQAAT
ncbi:MAG: energy transducer TonB [Acidobacteriota bacterium]